MKRHRYKVLNKFILDFTTPQDQYQLWIEPGDIVESNGKDTIWVTFSNGERLETNDIITSIEVLLKHMKIKEIKMKQPKGELVIYRQFKGDEMLICSVKEEKKLVKEWFDSKGYDGVSRNRYDYYRQVIKGTLKITCSMTKTVLTDQIIEEQ